jgi:hypothetical protein
MKTFEHRLYAVRTGERPDWANREDEWFAWHPVRFGPLGDGPWVWLRRVWRNRCCGVTMYQDLDMVRKCQAKSAQWTRDAAAA